MDDTQLDSGIKEIVLSLYKVGFRTYASCQGGKGHCFSLPIVRMLPDEGKTAAETHIRLLKFMINLGIVGYTISCAYEYPTSDGILGGESIDLELWDLEQWRTA